MISIRQMDAEEMWAWDRGSYDVVGRRVVELSDQLVATVERRTGGLDSRLVVDLACGTGNVALPRLAGGQGHRRRPGCRLAGPGR